MAEYGFKKSHRILKRREFLALADNGKVCHSRNFLGVFQKPCKNNTGRLGITVSKKVGNAVDRNRIKRLVREYWRTRSLSEKLIVDVNIIAKKHCADQSSTELFKSLFILFKKIQGELDG